jgi:hypothetical protein
MHRIKIQLIKAMTAVFIPAVLLMGCGKSENATAVRIAELVKDAGSVVRVADATDFEWDQLYIFPPYFLSKDIPKIIGASFDRNTQMPDISVKERDCFFVFLKDEHVVCVFSLWRHEGDFSAVDTGPYLPETARFEVYYHGRDVYGAPLKIMRCIEPSM